MVFFIFFKKHFFKIVSILFFGGLIFLGFLLYQKNNNLNLTNLDLNNTKKDLTSLQEKFDYINKVLEEEKSKNSLFENQINQIFGTVGTLDKLSKTDKELLQKYSKVYFLNEHYVPDELSKIPEKFVFEEKKDKYIHTKVLPFLSNMIEAGEREGLNLYVISSYRSFDEQAGLKSNYSVSFGSGANKFSADQGYSEHQLGTTFDFTSKKIGLNFTTFEKTDEYKWLIQNAYKFGFVLSYPKGNEYYQFEPWHWRFVGKSLAERLYEDKIYFYDLEQTNIDKYLISIFD